MLTIEYYWIIYRQIFDKLFSLRGKSPIEDQKRYLISTVMRAKFTEVHNRNMPIRESFLEFYAFLILSIFAVDGTKPKGLGSSSKNVRKDETDLYQDRLLHHLSAVFRHVDSFAKYIAENTDRQKKENTIAQLFGNEFIKKANTLTDLSVDLQLSYSAVAERSKLSKKMLRGAICFIKYRYPSRAHKIIGEHLHKVNEDRPYREIYTLKTSKNDRASINELKRHANSELREIIRNCLSQFEFHTRSTRKGHDFMAHYLTPYAEEAIAVAYTFPKKEVIRLSRNFKFLLENLSMLFTTKKKGLIISNKEDDDYDGKILILIERPPRLKSKINSTTDSIC